MQTTTLSFELKDDTLPFHIKLTALDLRARIMDIITILIMCGLTL